MFLFLNHYRQSWVRLVDALFSVKQRCFFQYGDLFFGRAAHASVLLWPDVHVSCGYIHLNIFHGRTSWPFFMLYICYWPKSDGKLLITLHIISLFIIRGFYFFLHGLMHLAIQQHELYKKSNYVHYCSEVRHQLRFFFENIFLFSRDALNWSKQTVKTFTFLFKKGCSFEHSFHPRLLKKTIMVSTKIFISTTVFNIYKSKKCTKLAYYN